MKICRNAGSPMMEAADQIDQDQSPQIYRGNNLYGSQELVADPRLIMKSINVSSQLMVWF